MHEVTNRLHQLTETKEVMDLLRINLHRLDPDYADEENAFHGAVRSLKNELKPDSSTLVDDYISAEEDRMAACLIYLFWQGLHQNEACFRDPVQRKFLALDFEGICQETVLNGLPEAFRVYECCTSLNRVLTGKQKEHLSPIASFYSYLETVGYKLAHYWGFRYGDELLPRVVPGYIPDGGLTSAYRRTLREYLAFDPEA